MRLKAARRIKEDLHRLAPKAARSLAIIISPARGIKPFADVRVYRQLDSEIRTLWRGLAKNAVHTPYQDLEWYEAWLSTVGVTENEKPFIVAAFDELGTPTLIVPLVVTRCGPITVARFSGGKHANYNFPLIHRDAEVTSDGAETFWSRLADLDEEIDLYWFDALPMRWGGKPNPFLISSSRKHASISSVIDLSGGPFNSSFRHRSSYRKLHKLGAIVERACSESDVKAALKSFLSQKSAWFHAKGLPNAFKQPFVPEFFLSFFSKTGSGQLYALRLNGDTLAVAGVVVSADRASLMLISYDLNHDLAKLGLGTHLLRSLIELMKERDIAEFDFGLGDAEYKRLLGARTESAFISVQAITDKGWVAARVLLFICAAKRHIKRSSRLFFAIQRMRRLVSRKNWAGALG